MLVTYVTHEGERFEVDVEPGTTVMQAAVDNGIDGIVGECGGACACATCHVYVDADWREKLTDPDDFERDTLVGAIDPQAHSRLGCQITLTPELDGLTVHMPAMQI